MAPHSSNLSWKIPWTEQPGRLQSMDIKEKKHVRELLVLVKWDLSWDTIWVQPLKFQFLVARVQKLKLYQSSQGLFVVRE